MKFKFNLAQKIGAGLVLSMLAFSPVVHGQVSMGKFNTYYSQNFDGLPNKNNGTWTSGTEYFTGWKLHRTKSEITNSDGTKTALNSLVVNPGTSNTGNLYSYGAANSLDRALGSIGSTNAGEFAYGLLLQNNSGGTIQALDVSYYGEQWRSSNSTAGIHRITFWYAIRSDKNAFDLWTAGDAGWIPVSELTFFSPVYYTAGMALDGNAAANRKLLSKTLAVNIPNGYYIMLRWKDADEPEADHGLAIDDVSLSWRTEANSGPSPMPVELKSFTAQLKGDLTELRWQTATEDDNREFVVERSSDNRLYEGIGLVNGAGNSRQTLNYYFTDQNPLSGTSFYRLKQIDINGTFTYSNIVSITKQLAKTDVQVFPTVTDHTIQMLLPIGMKYKKAVVVDVMGKQVSEHSLTNALEQSINVSHLSSGSYVLIFENPDGTRISKRFKKV